MRLLKLVVPFLLLAACGDPEASNRPPKDDPVVAPTVSSTVPADDGVGIAVNLPITATFSRAMAATTLDGSSFFLEDAAGAVLGVVTYAGLTATFTPAGDLAHDAVITATLTTANRDSAGTALAAAYSWSFTTVAEGVSPEISATRPRNEAVDVPSTEPLHATFDAAMDPATLNVASFGVTQGDTAIPGTVSYEPTSNTATFVPAVPLGASLVYVATISTEAMSAEGRALAQAYSWSFTTFAGDPAPAVTVTSPLDGALDVWSGEQPSATFDQAMAPATLTGDTFTVARDAIAVAGTVSYDAETRTAAFVPAAPLETSALYTATISTGAMSAAGQPLDEAVSWSFTTRPASTPTLPVLLGTAGNYVILAQTEISTVPASAITGDLGISPAAASYITGFSLIADPNDDFATSSQVTGNVYAADYAPPTSTDLTTAITDMGTAFTDAAGRAPDVTELGSGDIGGRTLPPGVYKWGTGLLIPTDVHLTGSATDVWIFQIAGDLTMAGATNVFLAGGALPKNVFWQVSGLVALDTTAHLEGVILCQTAITLRTGASVNGRLLAQSAVSIDTSTVVAPAP